MAAGISVDRSEIAGICRKYGVARLSFFGSVLREDFGPTSDVDVLVEFPADKTPSLLTLGGMQMELSELIGRDVDLKTPGFLPRDFRESVIRNAEVQYAS